MAERGYPDYQRVTNWDSPLVLNEELTEHEGEFTTERIECSRYANLAGKLQVVKLVIRVTLKWYLSESGGSPIGERSWTMDNQALVSAQLNIPNMGPWVTVTFAPEAVKGKYQIVSHLFLTNRVVPSQAVSPLPHLLQATPFKLGVAGVRTFTPEAFYGGPAELFLETTAAKATIVLYAMNKGYTYEFWWVELPEGKQMHAKLILPFTAWNVEVRNRAAEESTYVLAVTPSVSGSS